MMSLSSEETNTANCTKPTNLHKFLIVILSWKRTIHASVSLFHQFALYIALLLVFQSIIKSCLCITSLQPVPVAPCRGAFRYRTSPG